MKQIAIRVEPNGLLYMSKHFFDKHTDEELAVYNYQKIGVTEEEFENLSVEDFVVDEKTGKIYFSEELHEERLEKELEILKLPKLMAELDELSKDMVQISCGAVFEDKDIRVEHFRAVHNEIRAILGKEPREYR